MSNNLDLSQVAVNQGQKEVTINDQSGQLDAAMTEVTTVLVDSTNAVTLSNSQFRRCQFLVIDEDSGDPADATITITVPALKRGSFCVRNDSAFIVQVQINGQSKPVPSVNAGVLAILACDGTDVTQPVAGGGGNYDVGGSFGGTVGSDEVIFRFILPRAVTFPAGLAPSQGEAGVASTGTATFNIRKNTVTFGTMTFTTSATGVMAAASATTFAAGDVLDIIGPTSADGTLADLVFTISGNVD